MKVALVNQPWNDAEPPVRAGSIAIWNYRVARELAAACEVQICARASRGAPAAETRDGVAYRRFPTARDTRLLPLLRRAAPLLGAPFFATRWYFSSYTRQVGRWLADQQCNVIHVHNLSQMVPAIKRRARGARLVLHMHCEWLQRLEPRVVRGRAAAADLILGCSEHVTNGARAALPEAAARCRTVPNGVDTKLFSPLAAPRGASRKDAPLLLFVGRITPEKGLHVLLDAFRLVAARHDGARLLIVGPDAPTPLEFLAAAAPPECVARLAPLYAGGYAARLRDSLAPALAGRVRFAGAVPHTELPGLYRQADLLVNPSLSESFGMSLIEAMACGTPVIGARAGGMPEVIAAGETGLLVEPGEPEPLAAAILDLLGDPGRRREMGVRGRARAEACYSWQRVAGELLALYREIA